MLNNIFISLVFGACGALVVNFIDGDFRQRTFASVRLNDIVSQHMKHMSQRALSENEKELASTLFSEKLKLALQQVSREKRVLLLVAPAVLSDVPDYTDDVREQLEGFDE